MSFWSPIMIIAVFPLLIPLAAMFGQWTPGGPISITSGGAALALAAFWLEIQSATLAAANPLSATASAPDPYNGVIAIYTAITGVFLLVAAWAIALADAAGARRWGWVALLCLAFYATFAATFGGLTVTPLLTCAYSSPQPPFCSTISPVARVLIIVGSFVGPIAMLTYALRPTMRSHRAAPDGLSVSSIGAAADADAVEIERL